MWKSLCATWLIRLPDNDAHVSDRGTVPESREDSSVFASLSGTIEHIHVSKKKINKVKRRHNLIDVSQTLPLTNPANTQYTKLNCTW